MMKRTGTINGPLVRWEVEARSPIIFESSQGSSAFDIDGKEYLDLTACSGASPLGMNNQEFYMFCNKALKNNVDVLPSPVSYQRQELAERLVGRYKQHNHVFFLRTGSCATEAATRIARYRTMKPIVITAGFHGWHEQFQQGPWDSIAPTVNQNIVDFQYDLNLLEHYLNKHRGYVAGVFITPEPSFFPPEFIRDVGMLAHKNDTLFIVDEVLCGLRYAHNGYCYHHNIDADLITFAKGLAQGTALSAVVGTGDAMKGADTAYLGNTYLRENRAFVLGNQTQEYFLKFNVIETLQRNGKRLKKTLECAFKEFDIPAVIRGHDALFDVVFPTADFGHKYAQLMLKNGVYIGYPATYMSTIMMDDTFFQKLSDRLGKVAKELNHLSKRDVLSDCSFTDYASEAFKTTKETCLYNSEYWK